MIEEVNVSGPSKALYFSPWLDRETGELYGPASHATLAKHHAQHRDWSFKVQRPSKAAQSVDMAVLRRYMREADGTLRLGVPEGEARAYLYIEAGHSERWVARKLEISRRTVRVRMQRLMSKAVEQA